MLKKNIVHVASLLGDDTRAAIMVNLMDGKAFTASELARSANVSAQTASNHLKKLTNAHLIICEPAGRHRYYKLASVEVAEVLESLGLLGSPCNKKVRCNSYDKDICYARTCYDHLAGELGVELTKALVHAHFLILQDRNYLVSERGERFFCSLGIDLVALKKQKRQFAKACLDCTEREYHLAGALGSAILAYLIQNRLVLKSKTKLRVLVITQQGREWLRKLKN